QDSGCVKSSNDPLFDEENIVPTWGEEKTLLVTNNYPETRKFGVLITNPQFFDTLPNPLEQVMFISIKEEESGLILWGPKSLSDFKNAGEVELSNIPSGGSRNYLFIVELGDVDDFYQGKRVSFDLVVGFETWPVPEGNGSDEDGDDGDGDGDGQGGGSETSGQTAGAFTVANLAAQFGIGGLPQFFEEVAGAVTVPLSEPEGEFWPEQDKGEIKGTASCTDPRFWWVLFFVQALISYVLYRRNRPHYLGQLLIGAVFLFIFWRFFCPWWDVWVSGLQSIVWLGLVRKRINSLHG
ncbi:hypothetical protein KJ605_00310, partial [Patescibacteria group bacterium]|nr:hypothetical protein [Patescibacteria group bacterium]